MLRERISENIYWFQSETYAQVTAGVIAGPKWAVVIDTLMPQETLAMRDFIESKLNLSVRYVINTHHHADHSWGNCFFPGATVIAHDLCRQMFTDRSRSALEVASHDNPLYKQLSIVPPQITFTEGSLNLKVGKRHLQIFSSPGHSDDGISVLVEEDRILFTGDAFMPIPFIVEGNLEQYIQTTQNTLKLGLENIIQGHGEIILRGEIEDKVKENVTYLKAIQNAVTTARRRNNTIDVLDKINVEACGKSRILLGGLAVELHRRNLRALFHQASEKEQNA